MSFSSYSTVVWVDDPFFIKRQRTLARTARNTPTLAPTSKLKDNPETTNRPAEMETIMRITI
ncbi:17281_t:CDS:2 [Rhizophagus irregularis]|nr:17281_t:CDS:2 [Rhizophagus irregularis]